MEKLAAVYSSHIDEMADLITAEMGSPASFSRLGQAAGAASMMHLAAQSARTFPWAERRNGVLGEVHLRRLPVGVVGIIIPWNVPQNLLMPKLIPALIAGCTVVIKPAPETPLDSLWVAEMIEQIGLPEGVVSVVPGGREVGEELVRHPGVDKIAFTGSSATGSAHRVAVRRAAQALQPGTRRQVRRDRARRRPHRQDGGRAQDGQPDEQRPGLCGPDPHPGQRAQTRRIRRRAGRHDVGTGDRRSGRSGHRHRPAGVAASAAPGTGLHPCRCRRGRENGARRR